MKKSYKQLKEQMEIIDEFIEKAYEGMVIVDKNGLITKIKYERLLGINESDAIGKHVTDVIENTRLHKVLETGRAEIGSIQIINGREMVTTRIPIERDGEIVGAVGTVLFKDIFEVKYMADYIANIKKQMKQYKHAIKRYHKAKYNLDDILTQNPRMMYIKETAKRAAKTNSTVCIQGDSGTGKEYFAHSIHQASLRKYGPFVEINCSAIPKDLLESELFGYEPGAFTGASNTGKMGKFELASGGTIFLDEIGTMPLDMQAKLLRVLEEREFERIGGTERIEVDVRVISATNEHLKECVQKGTFREDLYYRLDVISIKIPPLSARKEDIPLLADGILSGFRRMYPEGPQRLSEAALNRLMEHDWPGNVRELRNIIERSFNMAQGTVIEVDDLPFGFRDIESGKTAKSENVEKDNAPARVTSLKVQTEAFEKEIIKRTIKDCNGNKTLAAEKLGLHRTALYKKMQKLGLDI